MEDPENDLSFFLEKSSQVSMKLSITKLILLLCFAYIIIALFVAAIVEILALVTDASPRRKRGPGRPKGSTKSPAGTQVIDRCGLNLV